MEQQKLIQQIIDKLISSKQTITFAESCTGGRIAAAFTSVSGASKVFNGSVVSYANDIKHEWLGVSEEILRNFGAVSKECVSEMLKGIAKMAHANYAIAISGIAGPTGGTEYKPVGTIYIGLLSPASSTVHHCFFEGDREAVQNASVDFAINLLAKELKIIS
jgi:nicotinamide-nucleotide amidase